ncbi:MAG: hypothetical protein OXG53_11175 [Chloroflexi bacterium]|nr:hypothetical protein [Chloroflexota bacterium]
MWILEGLMSLLRQLLQLLKSALGRSDPGARAAADSDRKLLINSSVDELILCTREQATAFYASLDGYFALHESLAQVDDLDELGDWFEESNSWKEANWSHYPAKIGTGISIMIQALNAQMHHSVIEQFVGEVAEIPADQAVADLRKMAVVDQAAMELNDSPDIELELNRIARQMPRCGEDRALEYYATRAGYEQVTDPLRRVDSWGSLREWLVTFHEWRQEAWADFYAQPCGVILGDLYYLESRTYLYAFMHTVGEDVDRRFLELNMSTMERELRDRTIMGRHTARTRRHLPRFGLEE